jgi:hypothetical protein
MSEDNLPEHTGFILYDANVRDVVRFLKGQEGMRKAFLRPIFYSEGLELRVGTEGFAVNVEVSANDNERLEYARKLVESYAAAPAKFVDAKGTRHFYTSTHK